MIAPELPQTFPKIYYTNPTVADQNPLHNNFGVPVIQQNAENTIRVSKAFIK